MIAQCRGRLFWLAPPGFNYTIECMILHHIHKAVVILVGFIIRQLIPKPQTNGNGNSHTQCEAGYVQKREKLVVAQVAKSNSEISGKHSVSI